MTLQTDGLDRRTLLRSTGGLLLASGIGSFPLWAAPLGANPFMLGVASGDPWPDGFVIWTRLAPRPLDEHGGMPTAAVPVRWEVSEDERFSRVVRKGEAIARPELAHAVHVEVDGLLPHRTYWYRFSIAGTDVSPVGRARTAPAPGDLPDRVRIGVAGCQHYETGYFDAWRHLSAEPDLDLIFHYGDYIYEGGGRSLGEPSPGAAKVVRQHVGGEIYSLDDYRRRYALYKCDPQLQAAHAACAFAASFDDHEVDNNWAGVIDQDGTDPGLFMLRRAAAFQAWYEHMPVRRAQLPTLSGVTAYRRLDYGRLLRVHVLDTRSHRSDQPCNDGKIKACPPEAHVSSTLLGAVQEQWLDEGLGHGRAWNLLAQQILVMPYDRSGPNAPAPDFAFDDWDGYRPARARLVESIRRHDLSNVVIASGDYHRHFVGTVPERDDALDGRMAAIEFLATSISSNGNGRPIPDVDYQLSNNPHLKLITDQRGYQLFDITPKLWRTDVKVVDQVERSGGKLSMLASFVATPDRVAVERA
ncbi:alkaline phosphatase D family protein [Novosphingobium sp. 17-62-19]|uniref:alkaline phosphatase D family protein n=1 Tax=Novosphingobium sp. 17-62-19 TaxID=1970406 RepID=UPI0025F67D08|nr:alkaline phosphatase D family protein [Novosphingobium sp. 17-62-19]HQS96332.1 alkaline phosphatase D family protein [Novosphingobium sp.]